MINTQPKTTTIKLKKSSADVLAYFIDDHPCTPANKLPKTGWLHPELTTDIVFVSGAKTLWVLKDMPSGNMKFLNAYDRKNLNDLRSFDEGMLEDVLYWYDKYGQQDDKVDQNEDPDDYFCGSCDNEYSCPDEANECCSDDDDDDDCDPSDPNSYYDLDGSQATIRRFFNSNGLRLI